MELKFEKYQATGNDFVMIDNRDNSFNKKNQDLIKKLCNRRFGIGSDGLILIDNDEDKSVQFKMEYFNPDGSQSLCGNGSRCAVHLANQPGIIAQKVCFLTTDGPHHAFMKEDPNNVVCMIMV